jgi:hypothetical protein
MINKKLMLGRKEVVTSNKTEQAEPIPVKKPDDEIDNFYEGIIPFDGELTDPFDCLPPNEPHLDEEEEEAVRQEQEEKRTEIPPVDENTEYETEVVLDEKAIQNTYIIINGIKKVLQTAAQMLSEATDAVLPQKRQYKNVAKFDKISHAKPKESQPSMMPKLILSAGITVAISAYFGVMANSYFIANADKKPTPTGMQCTFSWLMSMDTLQTDMSPFYADIFFTAFFVTAFIIAVALFLVYDSSAAKKRRREGKEHGAGRLATPTDFKKFKSRFMD